MTTHELAKYLLEHTPNLPVFMNGWGSEEGTDHEVTGAFLESGNTVFLGHGGYDWKAGEKRDWYMRAARLRNTDLAEAMERSREADVASGSVICARDARTILEMEACCFSEGIGPDSGELRATIARQHPEMMAEFPCLHWPNAASEQQSPRP